MSQLFATLYLDEDVDVLVATLLKSRGWDSITTRDAGMSGKTDPDQLAYAAANGLTLVTHNRDDFLKLADKYPFAGMSHAGIIIAVRRHPYELTKRLASLLDQVSAEEFVNQVFYI